MKAGTLKPISYLKEVRQEMKRVSWPSRQEATRLTLIVIGVSVVVGLFLGSLDLGFTKLIETILK